MSDNKNSNNQESAAPQMNRDEAVKTVAGLVKGIKFAMLVSVNDEVETRRGRQLHDGDVVELGGVSVRVAAR